MTISVENADELLSTTRAVRRRLDLDRPVPREVILECIGLSQQAPTASNRQNWRWIVVTDPGVRRGLADIYNSAVGGLFSTLGDQAEAQGEHQTSRVYSSAHYLAEHMHEVPALVVPCLIGRPGEGVAGNAGFFASIYPAVWSFNLALRARGLGTVLTTIHMIREKEAAALLGIPDDVTMAAMLPVAYTLGQDFKPADRPPPESITYWDRWAPAG